MAKKCDLEKVAEESSDKAELVDDHFVSSSGRARFRSRHGGTKLAASPVTTAARACQPETGAEHVVRLFFFFLALSLLYSSAANKLAESAWPQEDSRPTAYLMCIGSVWASDKLLHQKEHQHHLYSTHPRIGIAQKI